MPSDNHSGPIDAKKKAEFQKASEAVKAALAEIKKIKAEVKAQDAKVEALDKALE